MTCQAQERVSAKMIKAEAKELLKKYLDFYNEVMCCMSPLVAHEIYTKYPGMTTVMRGNLDTHEYALTHFWLKCGQVTIDPLADWLSRNDIPHECSNHGYDPAYVEHLAQCAKRYEMYKLD